MIEFSSKEIHQSKRRTSINRDILWANFQYHRKFYTIWRCAVHCYRHGKNQQICIYCSLLSFCRRLIAGFISPYWPICAFRLSLALLLCFLPYCRCSAFCITPDISCVLFQGPCIASDLTHILFQRG